MKDIETPMRKTLKATTAAVTLAAAMAFVSAPALAQHMGGGGHSGGGGGHAIAGGGFHGSAAARPGGQGHAADGWRGGWGDRDHDGDGWRGGWGGWRGGWGGWRGGWGCCGWGWGWGGYPWFWGGLGFATGVALTAPYYDTYDTYDYGYAAPSGAEGPPPPQGGDYNCTAWRWDPTQNKYVQVRSACN